MHQETRMTELNLAAVDVDGAIRDTAEAAAGDTRAGFMARAGMFGGGLLGAAGILGLGAEAASAQTTKGDIAILNYALTLEYLEAAFYTEAVKMGALSGELELFARVARGHERAHVAAIRKALGKKAVKKPKFDFRGTTEAADTFAATAQVLEDTGVAAYKGQAPRVKADAYLNVALAIHAVEARHASWVRDINGAPPAPDAFDQPKSMKAVLAAVKSTKFIVAPTKTTTHRTPRVTG
jgi:hypothetical protein